MVVNVLVVLVVVVDGDRRGINKSDKEIMWCDG